MIRIGIVGCGRILAAHLRGYRLLRQAGVDDFRITALCARRQADAEMYLVRGEGPPQRPAVSDLPGDPLSIGDEYLSDFQADESPQVFSDYRQMIASGLVDAVNDFSSHGLHHHVAEAALSADKDLMSQKPLAASVAAARRMCELADRRGQVFGVFENFRHLAATRHLRWWFEDAHRGGRVQMIWIGYVGAWWAPDRIVAHTPWRHRRREGGGISLDLGVHFFDQIRHVAGEIESVTAQTAVLEPKRFTRDVENQVVAEIDCDADDTCLAQFRTVSGAVGSLTASWCGHGGATLVDSGSVWYGTRGRVSGPQVTLDDGAVHSLEELYRRGASAERQARDFPLGLTDSFALAQYDWLEAVRRRRPPETDGWEGLRDLAAAYAIVESAHAGRLVAVADVLSGAVADYQRVTAE